MTTIRAMTSFGSALLAWGPLTGTAAAQDCVFDLVDVSTAGIQGNGDCSNVRVSANGRFVAFSSEASNLVPGDNKGWVDAFVRDLELGTTEVLSIGPLGVQGNSDSRVLDISADGNFVLFTSWANNLHPLDKDKMGDIYVRDRFLGRTELISVRYVDAPSKYNCLYASMSLDARFVAFAAGDNNVLPGDDNHSGDVFLRDRSTGTTTFVSVSSSGELGDYSSECASISADGSRIAFVSSAENFYPDAPDGQLDIHVFLRDRNTGLTTPVDVTPSGRLGNSNANFFIGISADGSAVAFQSWSTDLLGVPAEHGAGYIRDLSNQSTEAIPLLNGDPGVSIGRPEMSSDERYVLFHSPTKGWVANDPTFGSDVFLRDRATAVTSVISTSGPAQPEDGWAAEPSMSDDASVIAFISMSTTLVSGTTPNVKHVFVRICDPAPGLVFCYPTQSPLGCLPTMSSQGQSSASAGSGHTIAVKDTINEQIGLCFYGTTAGGAAPLANGFFCVQGPITRLAAQLTGGSVPPATDCTGSMQLDFNDIIASGQDPLLVAGTPVYLQSWTRDPTHAAGAILSDALAFMIGP